MSKTVYKSANGKIVDVDKLRLQNEEVITVGNTNTNARGDELGKGGKVVRTKDQVMKDYYKLKTPTSTPNARPPANSGVPEDDEDDFLGATPVVEPVQPKTTKKATK